MKLSLKLGLIAGVIIGLAGCINQPITYSHTDRGDFLTKESRGDNIGDYADLHAKAEDMCRNEGFKEGITVLDARPGNALRENGIGSYTLVYQCKSQSVFDRAVTAYGEVKKQFGN